MIYSITTDQILQTVSRQPIAMTDAGCHRKQFKRKGTSLLKIIRSASRLRKPTSKLTNCASENGMLQNGEILNNECSGSINNEENGSNLNIVAWNSCESLEDDETWNSRQNTSLRRSRASLVFPTSEVNPRSKQMNNHYSNKNNISRRTGIDKGVSRYNSVNTLSYVKTNNRLHSNQKSSSTQEIKCNEKVLCQTGRFVNSQTITKELDDEENLALSYDDLYSRYLSLPNVNQNISDMNQSTCDNKNKHHDISLLLNLNNQEDVCDNEISDKSNTCRKEFLESPVTSLQGFLSPNENAGIQRTDSCNSDYVVLGGSNEQERRYRVYKCASPCSPQSAKLAISPMFKNENNVFNFQELPSMVKRQLSDQEEYRNSPVIFKRISDGNNINIIKTNNAILRTNEPNHQTILRNSSDCSEFNNKISSKQFELRRSKSYSQVYKRQLSSDSKPSISITKQNRMRERINFKKKIFRSRSETDLKKKSREQLKQSMFVVRNSTSCRSLFDNRFSLVTYESQKGRILDRPRSISTGSNYLWEDDFPAAYAEAVLDCNSLNPLELSFLRGDVIAVYSMDDPTSWWGKNKGDEGWFSPSFVRVRISQITEEDEIEATSLPRMHSIDDSDETSNLDNSISGHIFIGTETTVSSDIRSKCIRELVTSEREYVKTLKDVIEGYYFQMREKNDMFSDSTIHTIFSNILDIFKFHKQFLEELKLVAALSIGTNYYQSTASIDNIDNKERNNNNNNNNDNFPASIGGLFEKHRQDFEIYSDYCNNHPYACMKLIELQKDVKYQQFFEACRLRQNMINISLDGFLLTPVQKICKYPLQLKELLKHTSVNHEDYEPVKRAWQAMRDVASLINECKRGVENISQLAQWQLTVYNWKGRDLTEVSSELIYKGKSSLTMNEKTTSVELFLFDHQLIICTPDSLDKNGLTYFNRINLDEAEHSDRPSSPDCQRYSSSPSCSWKIHAPSQETWYLFTVDNQLKQSQWSRAFERERSHIADRAKNDGIIIPLNVRRTAIELARKQKDAGDEKKRPQRKSMVLLPIIVDAPKAQKKIIRKLSFDYGMFSRKNRRQTRKESNNSIA